TRNSTAATLPPTAKLAPHRSSLAALASDNPITASAVVGWSTPVDGEPCREPAGGLPGADCCGADADAPCGGAACGTRPNTSGAPVNGLSATVAISGRSAATGLTSPNP